MRTMNQRFLALTKLSKGILGMGRGTVCWPSQCNDIADTHVSLLLQESAGEQAPMVLAMQRADIGVATVLFMRVCALFSVSSGMV